MPVGFVLSVLTVRTGFVNPNHPHQVPWGAAHVDDAADTFSS